MIKGNIIRLNTLHLNSASMNGVREVQGSSASGGGGIVPIPPVGNYIQFADAEVERVLMANGVSSDGIGITIDDAEKITTFSTWFKNNTSIVSFDEMRFFANVKTIAQDGFYGCSALTSIGSANIEEFKGYSCYKCTALTNVDFSSCKSIGSAAFYNCPLAGELHLYVTNVSQDAFGNSKLTKVYLYNVAVISKQAFQGSKDIEMVEIGDKITSIGSYAFYQSPAKMTTIICRAATPPTLGDGNTFTKATIYVPDASLEAYKTATNWNTYADRIHPLSEIEGSLVFYDKLVGDGTAYINTELMPNSFDNYEWKADPPMSVNKFIFGAKSTNQSALALVYSEGESYYLYTGHGQDPVQVLQENYDFMHRALRLYQRQSDGIWVRELCNFVTGNIKILSEGGDTENEYIGTLPLLLFACNKSTTNAAADRIYRGAIHSFIVTDSRTNEVRMSLKPCTWNGEAGMWDEVGNKFYGNAATSGEFSVAND